MGAVPATRANLKRLLRKGSVAVIVGGIAEVRGSGSASWGASPRCGAAGGDEFPPVGLSNKMDPPEVVGVFGGVRQRIWRGHGV